MGAKISYGPRRVPAWSGKRGPDEVYPLRRTNTGGCAPIPVTCANEAAAKQICQRFQAGGHYHTVAETEGSPDMNSRRSSRSLVIALPLVAGSALVALGTAQIAALQQRARMAGRELQGLGDVLFGEVGALELTIGGGAERVDIRVVRRQFGRRVQIVQRLGCGGSVFGWSFQKILTRPLPTSLASTTSASSRWSPAMSAT